MFSQSHEQTKVGQIAALLGGMGAFLAGVAACLVFFFPKNVEAERGGHPQGNTSYKLSPVDGFSSRSPIRFENGAAQPSANRRESTVPDQVERDSLPSDGFPERHAESGHGSNHAPSPVVTAPQDVIVGQADGVLVSPGRGLHSPVIHEFNLAGVKSGTLQVRIVLGSAGCDASFDLVKDPNDFPNEGRFTGIVGAHDVRKGTETTLEYQLNGEQRLYLGLQGNWFSPLGSTNTYSFVAEVKNARTG